MGEKILRQAQMVQLEHIRDDLLHDSEGRPPRKVTTSLVSISGPGLDRILLRMDRLRSEIRALAHRTFGLDLMGQNPEHS